MNDDNDILDRLATGGAKRKAEDFDGHFAPIIPFDQYVTPDMPATLLPPVIGDFVQNVSDVLNVPTAMPAMAALGMVSVAIAKKFVVSPKPDWKEAINIYTLTAMPPASLKSQTLKYLKNPIDNWEEMEAKRIAPAREKALTEIKLLQSELKKNYRVVEAKNSEQADIDTAKKKITALQSQIQDKQNNLPAIPQIYTTDATPEAIAQLVHEQGNRLGIISDEGGITEVLAGLYNNGNANIDIILKGIDGGATRIKRATRDFTLNPFLTIVLLIQPQVLSNMADKKAFTGNGALERYLYTLPIGNVGYRTLSSEHIDDMSESAYSNRIINLLHIPMPETPHVLQLETPAQAAFNDFWAEIERELRPDGKLHICMAWGGKLAGYTLRLAGLMHVAEHNSDTHLVIQKETMGRAIALARLLMVHAVAAFSMMGVDQEVKDARELFAWIKTQSSKPRLTKSDIINAMRNRQMGKKDRLGKAIAYLVESNILSPVHWDQSTKKPTEVYFINPDCCSD